MIVMVGETGSTVIVDQLRARGWGRMYVEKRPKPYPGEPWGFDNAAFLAWRRGLPFPREKFLRRLDRAILIGNPHLAVAPDIVADGQRSLDFSVEWTARLPQQWPWYLAVQDGMTFAAVTSAISPFAGLFLGGTDRFKRAAVHWCDLAHHHGRKFHYARAGTIRKLEHAHRIGADSLDSSFPLWSADRLKQFQWAYEGFADKLQQELFA